jgi:hypothetical protein
MTPKRKMARAPRQAAKDCRSHKRQDANAHAIRPSPCANGGCSGLFFPRRKGQRYCSAACRRADWLDRHYVKRRTTPEAGARTYRDVHELDEKKLAVALVEALHQEPHRKIADVAALISHRCAGTSGELVAVGFAAAYQYFIQS